MKIIAIGLLAFTCTVPGYAATKAELIKLSQAAVRENMKDPDSVRFRNVKVYRGATVCGEVNAKNSYGGYVGFSRFFVLAATVVRVEGPDDDEVFIKTYPEVCTNAQVSSQPPGPDKTLPPPPPDDAEIEATKAFFRSNN